MPRYASIITPLDWRAVHLTNGDDAGISLDRVQSFEHNDRAPEGWPAEDFTVTVRVDGKPKATVWHFETEGGARLSFALVDLTLDYPLEKSA